MKWTVTVQLKCKNHCLFIKPTDKNSFGRRIIFDAKRMRGSKKKQKQIMKEKRTALFLD